MKPTKQALAELARETKHLKHSGLHIEVVVDAATGAIYTSEHTDRAWSTGYKVPVIYCGYISSPMTTMQLAVWINEAIETAALLSDSF